MNFCKVLKKIKKIWQKIINIRIHKITRAVIKIFRAVIFLFNNNIIPTFNKKKDQTRNIQNIKIKQNIINKQNNNNNCNLIN